MEEHVLGAGCPPALGVGMLLHLLLAAKVHARVPQDEDWTDPLGLRPHRLGSVHRRLNDGLDVSELGVWLVPMVQPACRRAPRDWTGVPRPLWSLW